MSIKYSDLEVVVHDRQIEVWHREKHYLSIGISENAPLLVDRMGIPYSDKIPLDADKIDVQITVNERNEYMGIMSSKTGKASTGTIRAPRNTQATSSGSADSINSIDSNIILTDILTFFVRHPDATKKDITANNKLIAEQRNVLPMAVAGVLANYTRGAYGTPKTLLTQRRKAITERAQRSTR